MKHQSRLTYLDALRGVAAGLVLAVHLLAYTLPNGGWYARHIHAYFDIGHFGVLLFFCISGFVIPLSLEGRTLGAFWRGRALRLYPAYWASMGAALLLWAVGRYHPALVDVSPLAVAANAAMLHTLLGYGPLIPVYWSLLVELVWYVVASVVVRLGWRWEWVTLALLALALLAPPLPDHLAIPTYLPLLGAGACLYGAHQSGRWRPSLLVGLVVLVAMPLLTHTPGTLLPRLVVLPLFGVCVMWGAGWRWPGALLWLGRISYSLYLLHVLVIDALPGAGLLVWALLSVGVGWLGWWGVERPALAWAKRRPR